LIPKAMKNKTKFNEMHTIITNMNMLNENIHNLAEKINKDQVWGEHGIVKELINILNIEKIVELRYNVKGLESNDLKYYMEYPRSFVITKEIGTIDQSNELHMNLSLRLKILQVELKR
jgi:hypothetical protein